MSPARQGRLLLVEDEAVLRGLVAQFLGLEGYEVVEAADGGEGISQYGRLGPFDIVLLDLELPVCSGVEVCRSIRSQNPEQPVLICSAAVLDRHLTALSALGVDRILTKPYHPADLLKAIDAAGRSDQRNSRSPDRAHPVANQPAPPSVPTPVPARLAGRGTPGLAVGPSVRSSGPGAVPYPVQSTQFGVRWPSP